jgi:tetratricopeptide (TPR) repeat protein
MSRFPTPSEMMRVKRPYLYSDSECTDAYRLSESEFSHHLDTLTDRNQHKDFEIFSRKLSERELCPNLRPQTGPEGGGDGKVDTETYPVDERISERWYVGDGKSGTERWGFAFSAKKAWSDKVRSDVKGIVGTERGYDRIFFFTNRPARQRDRLRIEDELHQEHSVKVTILDREWIVDRIFSHGHKDLAYEYLKAGEHQPDNIRLGPRDFKRQQALDELEVGLKKQGSTAQEQTQAVSDTFEAARLSRELERPRFETEGRFKRAIDHAKKYGASYQHLRAVYEHAWTAFWWFDDIETMQDKYEQVEALAFASGHAVHISKVCNLYQLLVGRVFQGHETAEELSFADRSKRLKEKLLELAADKSRPNNALYAETLLVFHRMSESSLSGERENLDEIWQALCGIIDKAGGLGEFPADMLETMVEAIGESAPDSQAFDTLVEKLAEFMAERSKEIKAGSLYLQQGKRKLSAEKPVDGIKWLGRAVIHLSKDESREDQAKALYYLAVGYRGAGLRWAARATALASIIQYLAMSETEGDLRVETIPALNLFAMLALQLGHIVDVLSAIRFLQAIGSNAPLDDESGERLKNQITQFDQLLACLLIIQPPEEIRRLESLPDVLDGLTLFSARMALLYRLGHIDELKADGSIPEETDDHEIHEMMTLLASQPACSSLPNKVVLFDEAFSGVRTKILGVEIEIEASNTLEGVLKAETYAAAFEGFAATLLNAGAFPHTEKLRVRIRQLDNIQEASVAEDDDFMMEVCVPADWRLAEIDNIGKYNKHLIFSCIHALASVAMLRDAAETIEELVRTENVFERATLFCRAGISRSRVFGSHAGRISDWGDYINQNFPMAPDAPARPAAMELPVLAGEDEEEMPQVFGEIRSHNDVVVRAIINPRLWDAAEWKGMMYGVTVPGQPPFLGLIFANASKGEAIFKNWHARFGIEDSQDEIHISVIKGIDRRNPFHYRGHITQRLDTLSAEQGKVFFNNSRMNTMTVDNHRNLEIFFKHLKAYGAYFLVPAVFGESGLPELRMELAILKQKFHVREAWQIGPHDVDMMAVRPEDDVIIPEGETAPPVHELVKIREKRRQKG